MAATGLVGGGGGEGGNFRPHIAIEHLLVGEFRGHMQKFGPRFQEMRYISGFQNLVKLIFCFTLIFKNSHILLNLARFFTSDI